MPFGTPSEVFHDGFGLPEVEGCVINYDDTDGDVSDEEYEAAAQEAHDELVHSLIEAGGTIREARELLSRSLEMLYLLGYDSSFTNSAIDTLTTDIKKFLKDTE